MTPWSKRWASIGKSALCGEPKSVLAVERQLAKLQALALYGGHGWKGGQADPRLVAEQLLLLGGGRHLLPTGWAEARAKTKARPRRSVNRN